MTMHKATVWLTAVLLLVIGVAGVVRAQSLRIDPEGGEVAVGDTLYLSSIYVDANGAEQDTTADWWVTPDSLGSFIDFGTFVAENRGQGWIHALFGDLKDSVNIQVQARSGDDPVPGPWPVLRIHPRWVRVTVGDSLQVTAIYADSMGHARDTTAAWSLTPDSLGSVTANGLFTAEAEGEGLMFATLGDLRDSVAIRVDGTGSTPGGPGEGRPGQLFVMPNDTVVTVGSQLQYSAWYRLTEETVVETTATWTVLGMGPYSIGDISSDGLLSVDMPGLGIIRATVGDRHATATVVAEDTTAGDSLNSIIITREHRHGHRDYNVMARIQEGQAWTIGGIPHPMTILNGGMIYFPVGSLSEDVRIHVSLPGFADAQMDSVRFRHRGVITGVDFQVIVNDTISEPYYFDTPVIVSLPFKRGLLRRLNIAPTSLGMYFASTTVGDSVVFDTTGIGPATVDSTHNRIFAAVAHFSSLVLAERSVSTVRVDDQLRMPADYTLAQNFPNPFNPSTTIAYQVPERTMVNLTIYDMLGRRINTLVNEVRTSGTYEVLWDGTDEDGRPVSSGVYFYRLQTDRSSQMKRMVLLR